jgi:hypothetical protein
MEPRLRPVIEGALLLEMLGTSSFTRTGWSSIGSITEVEEPPFWRSVAILFLLQRTWEEEI